MTYGTHLWPPPTSGDAGWVSGSWTIAPRPADVLRATSAGPLPPLVPVHRPVHASGLNQINSSFSLAAEPRPIPPMTPSTGPAISSAGYTLCQNRIVHALKP